MPHIEIAIDSIPVGGPVRLDDGSAGIVVVRTALGVVAFEDACPHAGWRLSAGRVIDGRLECPGHGWEFELGTGRCMDVPAYCLRQLRVTHPNPWTVRIEWNERPAPACLVESA
jgi:nitrite reductase/ring-hydroxylating ferredoxin subunit